jgi:hypothetical protein
MDPGLSKVGDARPDERSSSDKTEGQNECKERRHDEDHDQRPEDVEVEIHLVIVFRIILGCPIIGTTDRNAA